MNKKSRVTPQNRPNKQATPPINGGNRRDPGFIRIIAGQWRGRKLPVHDINGLRPTTDRIKETLFNWLMQDIRDAHCLDCFCGSGALAFEALSRGAGSVTMIEKNPQAAQQLGTNLQQLNCGQATLINGDCIDYLTRLTPCEQRFDLVFIDPPFRQDLAQITCQLLEQQQLLTDNALIYVETETELGELQLPIKWQLIKQKNAGQVRFSLYQRQP